MIITETPAKGSHEPTQTEFQEPPPPAYSTPYHTPYPAQCSRSAGPVAEASTSQLSQATRCNEDAPAPKSNDDDDRTVWAKMKAMYILRLFILYFGCLLALITLGIAIPAMALFMKPSLPSLALSVIVPVLTLSTFPVMILLDRKGKDTWPVMPVTEIAWFTVLATLWIAGASINSNIYIDHCWHNPPDICLLVPPIQAFSYVSGIFVLGYALFTLTLALMVIKRNNHVFTTPIRDGALFRRLAPKASEVCCGRESKECASPTPSISETTSVSSYHTVAAPPSTMPSSPRYSETFDKEEGDIEVETLPRAQSIPRLSDDEDFAPATPMPGEERVIPSIEITNYS